MLKNNKGITLIALVVTIIVLLILAGVTIAMLTGTNGILTQASKAGSSTEVAEAKEIAGMDASALVAQFYEAKYVNNASGLTNAGAYLQANMPTEKAPYYTRTGAEITITPKDEAGATITGDIQTDGSIKWD